LAQYLQIWRTSEGKTNRKAKMSGGLIVYKSNHSFIQII
jgi:hypothetical protein